MLDYMWATWGTDPEESLLSRAGLCYLITLRKRMQSDAGRATLLETLACHLQWLSIQVVSANSGHIFD